MNTLSPNPMIHIPKPMYKNPIISTLHQALQNLQLGLLFLCNPFDILHSRPGPFAPFPAFFLFQKHIRRIERLVHLGVNFGERANEAQTDGSRGMSKGTKVGGGEGEDPLLDFVEGGGRVRV